jgi:hypothetical protein
MIPLAAMTAAPPAPDLWSSVNGPTGARKPASQRRSSEGRSPVSPQNGPWLGITQGEKVIRVSQCDLLLNAGLLEKRSVLMVSRDLSGRQHFR